MGVVALRAGDGFWMHFERGAFRFLNGLSGRCEITLVIVTL